MQTRRPGRWEKDAFAAEANCNEILIGKRWKLSLNGEENLFVAESPLVAVGKGAIFVVMENRVSIMTRILLCWVSIALVAVGLTGCSCEDPSGPDPDLYPEAWDYMPRWSWAGDRIVFSSPAVVDSVFTQHLFIVDTTGENRYPVLGGAVMAVWLPGDTELVAMGKDFKLYRLNLNTHQLTNLCDCVDSRHLELDPSGRYLYYEDAGDADGWAPSVYRMDLTPGDTTNIIGGSFPTLAPDGTKLVFYRHRKVHCYDLLADSLWVVYSPVEDAELDWAPDGSDVVVGHVNLKGYFGKLYRVKPDGTGAHQLSTGISPHSSRTGNRLSILRAGSDNRYHLFLIDPDGGNPKQLTF